jgi:hypothetical protein
MCDQIGRNLRLVSDHARDRQNPVNSTKPAVDIQVPMMTQD